uniref:Uncharacterized protein n=1 Tax=Magnetococcus massalia (strain MO-1) TaxID=451514 RepID=A0A1S7LEQ8_MAGMO|nr:protein of unknown function [Candidatus Magnetococcus massalia]
MVCFGNLLSLVQRWQKSRVEFPLARIFHEGWPEGGSRPAMARRGVKWSGEHSGSFVSGPFDSVTQPGATQPARSMGPHNGHPS